jgi:hypothetical protein
MVDLISALVIPKSTIKVKMAQYIRRRSIFLVQQLARNHFAVLGKQAVLRNIR